MSEPNDLVCEECGCLIEIGGHDPQCSWFFSPDDLEDNDMMDMSDFGAN